MGRAVTAFTGEGMIVASFGTVVGIPLCTWLALMEGDALFTTEGEAELSGLVLATEGFTSLVGAAVLTTLVEDEPAGLGAELLASEGALDCAPLSLRLSVVTVSFPSEECPELSLTEPLLVAGAGGTEGRVIDESTPISTCSDDCTTSRPGPASKSVGGLSSLYPGCIPVSSQSVIICCLLHAPIPKAMTES